MTGEEWKRSLALGAAGLGVFLAGRALWRRLRRFDFDGRHVLITGGSRGLGLILSRQLAEHGARLTLCARDADELARAEDDLRECGADVESIVCDVTDRERVEYMVRQVAEEGGPIDVLINNAGIIQTGPMETMTLDDFDEAMKVHFYGPLYTTHAVIPQMRARGEGRIVNITSIGGRISVPHLLPYNASKFALVGYSEGLRAELAKDGIVVTTVCPGLMRTGSPRNAFFKGQHRAEYAWFTIGDSLPLVSMSADRAARQIIEACRRGDADVTLSLPAKCAATFHGVFPGLTADILSLVNRLLPSAGGIGTRRARGYESESPWAPSVLTQLTERAAARNNELARPKGNGAPTL